MIQAEIQILHKDGGAESPFSYFSSIELFERKVTVVRCVDEKVLSLHML